MQARQETHKKFLTRCWERCCRTRKSAITGLRPAGSMAWTENRYHRAAKKTAGGIELADTQKGSGLPRATTTHMPTPRVAALRRTNSPARQGFNPRRPRRPSGSSSQPLSLGGVQAIIRQPGETDVAYRRRQAIAANPLLNSKSGAAAGAGESKAAAQNQAVRVHPFPIRRRNLAQKRLPFLDRVRAVEVEVDEVKAILIAAEALRAMRPSAAVLQLARPVYAGRGRRRISRHTANLTHLQEASIPVALQTERLRPLALDVLKVMKGQAFPPTVTYTDGTDKAWAALTVHEQIVAIVGLAQEAATTAELIRAVEGSTQAATAVSVQTAMNPLHSSSIRPLPGDHVVRVADSREQAYADLPEALRVPELKPIVMNTLAILDGKRMPQTVAFEDGLPNAQWGELTVRQRAIALGEVAYAAASEEAKGVIQSTLRSNPKLLDQSQIQEAETVQPQSCAKTACVVSSWTALGLGVAAVFYWGITSAVRGTIGDCSAGDALTKLFELSCGKSQMSATPTCPPSQVWNAVQQVCVVASATPTASATATQTPTASASGTIIASSSGSATSTATPSNTASQTPTSSPSATSSASSSLTASISAAGSATLSSSTSVSATDTQTPTASASGTIIASSSGSATSTATPSNTPSQTPTSSPSATSSASSSLTASISATGSATSSSSASASTTSSLTRTASASPSLTATPTASSTAAATGTPTASRTPSPSRTPSTTIAASPSPSPSRDPWEVDLVQSQVASLPRGATGLHPWNMALTLREASVDPMCDWQVNSAFVSTNTACGQWTAPAVEAPCNIACSFQVSSVNASGFNAYMTDNMEMSTVGAPFTCRSNVQTHEFVVTRNCSGAIDTTGGRLYQFKGDATRRVLRATAHNSTQGFADLETEAAREKTRLRPEKETQSASEVHSAVKEAGLVAAQSAVARNLVVWAVDLALQGSGQAKDSALTRHAQTLASQSVVIAQCVLEAWASNDPSQVLAKTTLLASSGVAVETILETAGFKTSTARDAGHVVSSTLQVASKHWQVLAFSGTGFAAAIACSIAQQVMQKKGYAKSAQALHYAGLVGGLALTAASVLAVTASAPLSLGALFLAAAKEGELLKVAAKAGSTLAATAGVDMAFNWAKSALPIQWGAQKCAAQDTSTTQFVDFCGTV